LVGERLSTVFVECKILFTLSKSIFSNKVNTMETSCAGLTACAFIAAMITAKEAN
jgi:hypothetical protein